MRAAVTAAVASVVLATLCGADSIGTILNTFNSRTVAITGLEVGHSCWTTTVGGNNDVEFYTTDGASCLANFDEISLAMQDDSSKKCSTRYAGVHQLVPTTGKDVYLAQATLVGPTGNADMPLCALSAVAAMENVSSPVAAYSTCPQLCANSAIGQYSTGVIASKGPIAITANVYSSIYTGSCWSSSIGVGASNQIHWNAGGNADCTSPTNMIQLTAPFAQGCNVTLEPVVPHALAMWVGYEGNAICVSPVAVASVNNVVQSSFSGACPPCTGASPGVFPASFDLAAATAAALSTVPKPVALQKNRAASRRP